ncbi:MAG: hypothetical protein H6661_13620 [Ardenticatenaceae bacterium]|nr:hypothetical protein [Ardenticatenaceae bacterium]
MSSLPGEISSSLVLLFAEFVWGILTGISGWIPPAHWRITWRWPQRYWWG